MKYFAAVLLLMGAVAWAGPTNSKNGDEAQIRALLDGWHRAFEARDVEGVMRMYAGDDRLVAYDIVPPLAYRGHDAYKKDYADFFAAFEGPLRIENHTEQILKGGQKVEMAIRWTDVFRKLDGKWLVVHEHISVPADLDTGKAVLDAN